MAAVETPSVDQPPAAPAAASATQVPDTTEGTPENASLYVGDLDKDVQETHLFELFSEVWPVWRLPHRRRNESVNMLPVSCICLYFCYCVCSMDPCTAYGSAEIPSRGVR